jgi:hypothetical protein
MKKKILTIFILALGIVSVNTFTEQEKFYHPEFRESKTTASIGISEACAYPPAVGILSNSTNCLACHVDNGAWKDDANTIIDILDKDSKKSFKQTDGSFLIETPKGKPITVLTVIGSQKHDSLPVPYRNAWLYIDPATIGTTSLSKFATNWDVNLPMSCRLVGDNLKGFEDANITSLPMTIQPLADAKDAELTLQVMLTKGESVKGNAQEGMIGNYFERKVNLKVK